MVVDHRGPDGGQVPGGEVAPAEMVATVQALLDSAAGNPLAPVTNGAGAESAEANEETP